MERLGNAGELAARSGGSECALSIGNFDGLHLGHREVVGRCVTKARVLGVPAVVLTFEPHPLELLAPGRAPRRLTTPGTRASLLADLGVDILVEHPFTMEMAEKDPGEFIRDIVRGMLHARFVAVGSGFRFGKGRVGDGSLMGRMAAEAGFEASVVQDVVVDGDVVSSTRIRGLIARDGDVRAAARLLGRPLSVTGEIVRGRRLGRSLGFPTANLAGMCELLPSSGVYAATAVVAGGGIHAAAVHLGPRLTFDGESTVEAHILGRDDERDLYGESLRIDFIERIREPRKFEGKDALVTQIRRDVDLVSRIVGEQREALEMSKDILGKLSPDLIRDLARRRGHEPEAGEKTEDTARWLLEHYASGVGDAARGGKDMIMERARKSIGRLRAAVGLSRSSDGPEPVAEGVEPLPRDGRGHALDGSDTMPKSPALRTRTLAEVYEKQGMTAEALQIYRDVVSRDPGDLVSARAIERLSRHPARDGASDPIAAREARSDGPREGRAEPGPAVGHDAWSPHVEPAVRDHSGPWEIPDLAEPPERYGADEAFLMMVSPTTLYACWEISPETEHRAMARAGGGPARPVLRIIRMVVSGTGDVSEDVVAEVDAPGTSGDYFFHGAAPDTIYRMEVGFVTAQGLVPAVLGNPAATSADGPAERFDEEWMVVDQEPLTVRRPEVVPLEVKQRTRLTPRQTALLKLYLLGPDAYGALTGIDPNKLRSMVVGLARAPVAGSNPGSSDINALR